MSKQPRRLAVAAALMILVSLPAEARAQVKQTTEQVGTLRYLQYLPQGHDPARRWPVLMFLHGGGEFGTDITQLLGHSLPALVEQDDWSWPFIVVSPQAETGAWLDRADDIAQLLDRVELEQGGDPNRLYLTGLSMGGIGTFDLGIVLAERWAALLPLCSNAAHGTPWDERSKLVSKPVLVVHGTADSTVPFQGDVDRIADLEALGVSFFDFDYTLGDADNDALPAAVMDHRQAFGHFVGYGHNVWDAVYGKASGTKKTVQYEWLLSHSLDGTPFADPRFAPIDPGSGGAGGTASAAGAAGGGQAGLAGSSAPSAGSSSGGAGGISLPEPTPSLPLAPSPSVVSTRSDSGCQLAGGTKPGLASLGLLASLLFLARRRSTPQQRAAR